MPPSMVLRRSPLKRATVPARKKRLLIPHLRVAISFWGDPMQVTFSDPHASFSEPWACAGMPGLAWACTGMPGLAKPSLCLGPGRALGPGPGPGRPRAQNLPGPGRDRHRGPPEKKATCKKLGPRPFRAAFLWGHPRPKDRGAGRGHRRTPSLPVPYHTPRGWV